MPVKGTTLTSLRPLMQGVNGMVVASHPSAAMAGLEVLKNGGNAIDAGVAVGLALNVVHVDDCSFLGVAPTVIYLADRKEVTTIDGLGVWPKAASVEYFHKNHGGKIPTGVLTSLTPAAADSWLTSLSKFGTMTFGQVATAAIDLAGNGFPMFRYLAGRFKTAFDQYNAHPSTAEIYLPGGRAPRQGEMFYQKDLAATLSKIADVEASYTGTGREAALKAARDYIYTGELGRRIVAYNREMGGLLTEEDLARYHVQVAPPVTVNYKGYDVYSTGPWGQGPTFPQALKILEGYDLASMGHNSAEYIHTVNQALNLAFADREQYVGDPDFVDVPINEMLAEEYLAKRRSLIDPDLAWPGTPPAGDPRNGRATFDGAPQSPREAAVPVGTAGVSGGGTSYFAVIDRDGNIFSSTPSEGTKNGGPIIPGTGLTFSLRGTQSKLTEGHPAAVAGGKRPRLTPAPALVLRDGEPVMALGAHGGDHIPQGTLQLLLNVLEFGRDPQEAVVSRVYTTALNKQTNTAMPIQVMCTATKEGDRLKLDFDGSSPQMANDANSTLPSTFAHVGVALTNTLFWDVPWSDGKLTPVEVSVPEGTVLNCVFPAACGFAPWIGEKLVAAVVECMAKMLYAAGRLEDVNASWYSLWAAGGPGYFPGGTNREGIRTAQGIYDIHGGGLGAAPHRDGVNTGGHMNIPSGGISDVERIEMQYPLLYFTRNHNMDGPGAGKYRGGLGSFRVTMVYGSQDFTNDYKPYGGIPQGAFGLFGGYPVGSGAFRAIFNPAEDVWERMKNSDYPTHPAQVVAEGWGEVRIPEGTPERLSVPEFSLMSDFTACGGGFGDPLERDPQRVARDVRIHAVSKRMAEAVYGVVLDGGELSVDEAATAEKRRQIRAARLADGTLLAPSALDNGGREWRSSLRFHEYLEIVSDGSGERAVRCISCGYLFCGPEENYKKHSVRLVVDPEELSGTRLPSDEDYLGRFHLYACPGCATLLQVDVYCPALGGDEDLMDIRVTGNGRG